MQHWKPDPGLSPLIEPDDPEPGCESLTGEVVADEHGRILVDLGSSPRPTVPAFDAVVSFFTPDALHRASCVLTHVGNGTPIYELTIKDMVAVQRREALRRDVELIASLSALDTDGPITSVRGRTLNVSSGGCRIITQQRFPPGEDPTVSLVLTDGGSIVAQATILSADHHDAVWDYRLVFTDIELDDRVRLATLATN